MACRLVFGGKEKKEVFFQALEIFFYFTATSAMYIKKMKKYI